MRFAAADTVYMNLELPSIYHRSTLVSIVYLGTRFQSLVKLMASLASCYKEIFLRRPPPPFDYNSTGERRSIDVDEDWLPDVKDIISGDFNVLIDLTGDFDSEVCHHARKARIITVY